MEKQEWVYASHSEVAQILGVDQSDFSDYWKVKIAFRNKMIKLNYQS